MKKFFSSVCFTFMLSPLFAQNVVQIVIDNRGNNDVITFLVDESVAVNLSKDGKIIEWGTEYTSPTTGVYPKLEKYMGKEEYYSAAESDANQGKVKYIGSALITYYSADDDASLKGKVKSIGITTIDYYRDYEDAAFKGFIKNAGPLVFTYYASYADESYKGRIKSAGGTPITFYGNIDDKAYRGKVKNVGRNLFTYYSSYDKPGYAGSMKSGFPMVSDESIKYIVKNY